MKLPAIQLYPGDWLRDDIAGCSLAAQGLWIRMMFIAHDSERYGYLCLNGNALTTDFVARRCGSSRDDYVTLLAELDRAGIPSRTPEGIIYSRRMVRDAKARIANSKRQQRFRDKNRNGERNDDVTQPSQRSSSSSSSSIPPKAPQRGAGRGMRDGGGRKNRAEADREALKQEFIDERRNAGVGGNAGVGDQNGVPGS